MARVAALPPSRRFIEAFDGVRHAFGARTPEEEEERRRNELLANAEFVLAMLFGEQVVLPVPYAFDSPACAAQVLELYQHRDRHYAVKRNPLFRFDRPVLVALPGAAMTGDRRLTFRELIVERLRRFDAETGARFILSSAPQLDENFAARASLADALSTGWTVAGRNAPRLFDNLVELEHFDRVCTLGTGYFARQPRIEAAPSAASLDKCVDWLADLPEAGPGLPDDRVTDGIRQLRAACRRLKERGVRLTDRSDVRVRGRHFIEDDDVYHGVVEFVDSAYSEVLSSSVRADGAAMSTRLQSRAAGGSDLTQLAQELAGAAFAHHSSSSTTGMEGHGARSVRYALRYTIHDDAFLRTLRVVRPEHLWTIFSDGDWQASVLRVRAVLQAGPKSMADRDRNAWQERVREARAAHLQLISNHVGSWHVQHDPSGDRIAMSVGGQVGRGVVGDALEVALETVFVASGAGPLARLARWLFKNMTLDPAADSLVDRLLVRPAAELHAQRVSEAFVRLGLHAVHPPRT